MAAFYKISTALPFLILFALRHGAHGGVLHRRTDDSLHSESPEGWKHVKYPNDAGANLEHYPEAKGGWENVEYPSDAGKQHDGPQEFDSLDGWTHFGCWSAESPRALTTAATSRVKGGSKNMTVSGCIEACDGGHYPLSAFKTGAGVTAPHMCR